MTQETVQMLFDYNPETGVMRRKISVSSRAQRGYVVGCETTAGYLVVRYDGKLHYVHRLIWLHVYGAWPVSEIDHIDGNRRNNKLDNLREVTRSQNLHNKDMSGGVYWSQRDKVWVATIQVAGIRKHIGQSKVKKVAELLYRAEKLKHLP
jgi:hypothetical protein